MQFITGLMSFSTFGTGTIPRFIIFYQQIPIQFVLNQARKYSSRMTHGQEN